MRKKLYTAKCAGILAITLLLTACGSTDYSKYVDLCDYKNLAVEKETTKATSQEIQEQIDNALSDYIEYQDKDDPAEEGDEVSFYFTAVSEGETLYDYSDEVYETTIGQAEFGTEFDKQLTGAKPGDRLTFTITYDEDFEDAALYGKTADYEVTIEKVSDIIIPELTDDFVSENLDYDTAEEFKAAMKQQVQDSHDADDEDSYRTDLLQAVVDNSDFSGYPASLYKTSKEATAAEYESYTQMFNCSLEEVYKMLGSTKESRKEEILNYTYQQMVVSLIQQKEKITVSDEEYNTMVSQYATDNDYDSVDALMEDYSEDAMMDYCVQQKVIDLLENYANPATTE